MNKFQDKINKFLRGRYGIDELYRLLLIICLIVIIINMLFPSTIFRVLELIIFVICIYRVLSRDITRRRMENQKYLELRDKIISFFNYQKKKYNDRNTHMYKKCPYCHQKIRLPLKKGKHKVKCPNCKREFEVKCRKNEKIKVEIVK